MLSPASERKLHEVERKLEKVEGMAARVKRTSGGVPQGMSKWRKDGEGEDERVEVVDICGRGEVSKAGEGTQKCRMRERLAYELN